MAYIKKIIFSCDRCDKEGLYQVFNTRNAPSGTFCKEHAKWRKRELDKLEQEFAEMQASEGR